MAKREKVEKKKGVPIVVIILAVVIVGVIIYGIASHFGKKEVTEDGTLVNEYAQGAKDADDIKIKDSDSKEVKIEKLQGKIELLNKEIEEKQSKIDEKNTELNKLYEDYVNIMNESQGQ